jgi:hypothetical protein
MQPGTLTFFLTVNPPSSVSFPSTFLLFSKLLDLEDHRRRSIRFFCFSLSFFFCGSFAAVQSFFCFRWIIESGMFPEGDVVKMEPTDAEKGPRKKIYAQKSNDIFLYNNSSLRFAGRRTFFPTHVLEIDTL